MKIEKRVEDALNATGLPWNVELGGKHIKIKLQGRLVAIQPRGPIKEQKNRATLNIISQIKRAAREIVG